ncbi:MULTISPECIES: ThiF family adenylyltransferase [unclassified Mesorhizobium]|uniref:HesA/MoeB/ThiF family protein n=1 Tax=unclassified Mesorhizobium TaxID=325217 RepID=UPI001FDA2500|nr:MULTISPECIES: ThiF family adenylyltransferase [unclassified Mesorhizobium]
MAAFKAKGATVKTLNERHGLLILEVVWPLNDKHITLQVGYSSLHPFCRPVVSSSDLRLPRHQHPFDGGLCLLIADGCQWHPHQRVADLIDEQLNKILRVIKLREDENWSDAAQLEEQAPDPLAAYYGHDAEPISAVFFSELTKVPNQSCGIAEFSVNPRGKNGAINNFEAIMHCAKPVSGSWFAPPFEPGWVGAWQSVVGRWVRLKRPLPRSPEELWAAAETEIAKQPVLNQSVWKLKQLGEVDLALTAILFDEEVDYGPHRRGDGWLFLANRSMGKGKRSVTLVRGFGISENMFSRVPAAAALRGKKILLIGCGAIGSFAAMEFARAGVGKLTIVDHDIVEPGNSVRWPLGRAYWGVPKVAALREVLLQNYPSTNVQPIFNRLGAATTRIEDARKADRSPRCQFRQLVEEADLIIDATASTECQASIAHECRALGKPLVVGYATEGVAGGIVVRLRPDLEACWVCLNEHWNDKSIDLPPQNPTATVLPVGCNAPTFTGGSFDLQEVSLEVVRSGIGLLAPSAYDPGDWDWASLKLVEGERRCLPTWVSGHLEPHARCTGCCPR